MTNDNIF